MTRFYWIFLLYLENSNTSWNTTIYKVLRPREIERERVNPKRRDIYVMQMEKIWQLSSGYSHRKKIGSQESEIVRERMGEEKESIGLNKEDQRRWWWWIRIRKREKKTHEKVGNRVLIIYTTLSLSLSMSFSIIVSLCLLITQEVR